MRSLQTSRLGTRCEDGVGAWDHGDGRRHCRQAADVPSAQRGSHRFSAGIIYACRRTMLSRFHGGILQEHPASTLFPPTL
jgi:hypothetical protein